MSPSRHAIDGLCDVIEVWGKAMRMRAVECAVPGCLHIHAQNDEALVELVLRHSHQAHPEMHLREQAAEDLVDESAYNDKKHAKRTGLLGTLRNDDGGVPPIGIP
jgi:predicted small metal-binding protein